MLTFGKPILKDGEREIRDDAGNVAYGEVADDGSEYMITTAPTQAEFDAISAQIDAMTPEQKELTQQE